MLNVTPSTSPPCRRYHRPMDRTEWVSRFMHRMEQLDVRLRPAELAEIASALFSTHGSSAPEAAAEEAGKNGVRRDD